MVDRFCRGIDTLNEWVGKIFSWLIIPLTVLITAEVVLRYIFNKPTIWTLDVNIQLLATLSVMGAGYVLLHNGHIRMDMIVLNISKRKRALLEITTGLLFLFVIGIIVWKTSTSAWQSLRIRETSSSVFHPPVYPIRFVMAIGVVLLLLQGITKFIRDIRILLGFGDNGETNQ
jgi:TRAP-type mannitol/chloroaromatic compound transport system permease small subunit